MAHLLFLRTFSCHVTVLSAEEASPTFSEAFTFFFGEFLEFYMIDLHVVLVFDFYGLMVSRSLRGFCH